MQATLLTLAIAVILALLAALLGPHFVDWNAQRGNFEQQASALIGLPVRVAGKMDVRLLPSPSLVLSDIEIGKPGDAQTMRAKALGMEFALPALLSGKLRAVELKVIGPELKLSLDRDGRAVLPQALAGMNADALSIDKLQIEDARIELSDAASGARITLGKLWFNGEVRALPGPFRGEGAFVMDGGLYGYRISSARPEAAGARVKLTLDPSDRPLYAEAEGLLNAEGGAPRFEGIATVARRNAAVKGDKAPPGEPWKITSRVKANAASALFEQVEFQYGPDERAIKLAGTAEAKFGAKPRLDAVLSARQLDADKLIAAPDSEKRSPRAAIAALISTAGETLHPPLPTQLGFSVDAVTLGGGALQDLRGDLEFGAGGVNVTGFEARGPGYSRVQASGRIDFAADHASFFGPVEFSAVDPRAFAEWLDGKAAASPLAARPLKVRGELTLGPGRVAIEHMNADYDRNAIEGGLSYEAAEAGKRARLEAKLRADDLDLDAWLALFGASLSDVAKPQDVSLSLTLGRLRFAGLEAGKADIAVNANATGIAIERFSIGDLGGAALGAKGRIDLDRDIKGGLKGGLGFDLSLRDAAALRALGDRFAPSWSETVRRVAPSALPAKLAGRLDIEPAATGNSRFVFAAKGPVGANTLDLTSSLTGVWNNPRGGEVALKASVESADVNALVGLVAPDRIAPVARQAGRFTLSLAGKPDGEMKIDARLASTNLDLRAAGNVRSLANEDRSGTLDIAIGPSRETQPHVIWSGSPSGGVPVSLKSALKFDAVGMRLDHAQASIGGTDVTGRLGIGFGKPMVIDGDLKSAALDLPALLAAATGIGTSNDKWSETPFATTAWPSMIGAVSVNAARATVLPVTRAANLRAGLRFTGNDVAAEQIEAEMFGGRLSGEMVMRRGGEGLGISGRIALRDADAAQMLAPENASALAGRVGLQLQFDGAGLSPRALIGSLNGSGKITLDKGRVAALDPRAFATAVRSIDQGLPLDASRIRDVVTRALDAGPLVVHNAEAQLSIAAGVIRIESFAARSDAADLIASGSYNLADSGLDARFALRGPAVAGVAQRPELAIQLRGPALSPQKSLDVSALTGWLALRSVDQQTRRIEAIEQGRPAETALQKPDAPAAPPGAEPSPTLPEVAPALPRRRPSPQAAVPPADPQPNASQPNTLQPSTLQSNTLQSNTPQQAPRLEPLPAPIEIPARPRVAPRVDAAPQRPADTQANPFPKPLGSPQPPQQAPRPPGGRVNPVF